MDCLFCNIIAGKIPSAKVYEDARSFAFLDIRPVNPGHVLLVPKEHHANIYEMPDTLLSAITPTIKKLAVAVKKAARADAVNISMNNDPAAGQTIFHAHIHIIPRYAGDGYKPWIGRPYVSDEEQTAMAKKIRASM